jgi:hypothetical protein
MDFKYFDKDGQNILEKESINIRDNFMKLYAAFKNSLSNILVSRWSAGRTLSSYWSITTLGRPPVSL